MNKKFRWMIILSVLVGLMLPATAIAAGQKDVDVHVRNQTQAQIRLSMVSITGEQLFITLAPGQTDLTLAEGIYDVYMSTDCGNQAGNWNLNVTKTLYVTCKQGHPTGFLAVDYKEIPNCIIGIYMDGYHIFWPWNDSKEFLISVARSDGWSVTSPDEFVQYNNTAYPWTAGRTGCYDGVTSLAN